MAAGLNFSGPERNRILAGVERVLGQPPIDDFDSYSTEELVTYLQSFEGIVQPGFQNASNVHYFWSKITNVIGQLKHTRSILTTLSNIESKKKKPKLKIKVPQDEREYENGYKLESSKRIRKKTIRSPLPPPPSPISLSKTKRKSFCDGDGKTIIATMFKHKHDETVQEKGCVALFNCLKQMKKRKANQESKQITWKCGVCSFKNMLPTAELSEEESSKFKCYICAAPHSQSKLETVTIKEDRKKIYNAADVTVDALINYGLIGAIIDAMRTFSRNIRIQRATCFSLSQLINDDPKAFIKFATAGGLSVILTTMKNYYKEIEIQAQSLGILASPNLLDESVIRIEIELFSTVVVSTMRRYPNHQRIQALSCIALANLAYKNEQNVDILTRGPFDKLITQVFKIAKKHEDSAHVTASVLWLLVSFTREIVEGSRQEIKTVVRENGGIQFCLEALANFPVHPGIQQNVKALLSHMGVTIDKSKPQGYIDLDDCTNTNKWKQMALLPQDQASDDILLQSQECTIQ